VAKKGEYKKGAKADSVKQRKYNSTDEQKANRAARNKARRAALKEGKVRKGDNKDIDHKKELSKGGSKSLSNTRVADARVNRRAGSRIGGQRTKAKYSK